MLRLAVEKSWVLSKRALGPWPGVLALTLCACGFSEDRAESFTTFDSAGVRITESASPLWANDQGWTVGEEPRLEIGVVEGGHPYLFDRIRGVAVLDGGTVVVANRGDYSLRYFDEAGRFLHAAGGFGEGPEELADLVALYRAGDDLYAYQYPEDGPIKIFGPDGLFMRPFSLPLIPSVLATTVYGVFSDGSILLVDDSGPDGSARGVYTQLSRVLRVTPDGAVDTLGVFPGVRGVVLPSGRMPVQQYGPYLAIIAAGNRVYYSSTETFEIGVLDTEGHLLSKVRRTWSPLRVTEQDRSRYRSEQLAAAGDAPPQFREMFEELANEMQFPQHHPALHRLLIDQTDHIWAQRTNPRRKRYYHVSPPVGSDPVDWDVFDPDGVWLGAVQTPAQFLIRDIGEDYVAGVWTDEQDVEFVRVYDLQRD